MKIIPETLNWQIEDNKYLKAVFDYRPKSKGYIRLQLVTFHNNAPLIIVYVYEAIRHEMRVGVVVGENKDAINKEITRLITTIYEEHSNSPYRLYNLMTDSS